MKNGFTLLELIVVIVILGILATLGYSQYITMAEKGRAAEAKAVLGTILHAVRHITFKMASYQPHCLN